MKPKSQGISSNKLVRPGVRTGAANVGVQPAYAAQLGQMQGDHATDKGDLKGASPVPMQAKALQGPKHGNELALNVGKGGPGTGRTVYRSGYQATHGPVNRGEAGIIGTADRGPRAIMGRPGQKV